MALTSPAVVLALGAALTAGTFAAPAQADEHVFDTHTTVNHCVGSVPETDVLEPGPVQICYSLHRPKGASVDNPVPVVLHSHGWGGSRSRNASSFSKWLDAGFGVLSFDQRGFGESGGKAHVEDPAFEGEDVIRMIDVVADQHWTLKNTTTVTDVVTPDNGRSEKAQGKGGPPETTVTEEVVDPRDPVLGAIGGSYGGGYQFVGAFTELAKTGSTRFDALAPEITWYDLSESLAPQEVVRTAWVSALYAAGADAHTSTVHAGFAEGVATGQWPASMSEFFADNGPAHHVAARRALDIPTLLGQGATDNLFPLDQGLKNFQNALTDEARAKSIFVGYNGGHALPNVLPPGYGTAGDPCSVQLMAGLPVSNRPFEDLAVRFMRENLLGASTGLAGHAQYHLATADASCVTVDAVGATTPVELGTLATPTAAGTPLSVEVADGGILIAGTPTVDALVTAAGVDTRAFFALSVGTSPANARVVQNNVLPLRELLPVVGAQRSVELPSIAVEVPAGQKLFLTISPVSEMFGGHGSRTPGAFLLQDVVVNLPVQPTG